MDNLSGMDRSNAAVALSSELPWHRLIIGIVKRLLSL